MGAPGGYTSNEGTPTPVDCAEGGLCHGVRAIQSCATNGGHPFEDQNV